jgi:hypothetical protein
MGEPGSLQTLESALSGWKTLPKKSTVMQRIESTLCELVTGIRIITWSPQD